jgi:hypothetical protein
MPFYNYDDPRLCYLYFNVQFISINPCPITTHLFLSIPLRFRFDIGWILQLTFNSQSSIAWCFLDAGCWFLDTCYWLLVTDY